MGRGIFLGFVTLKPIQLNTADGAIVGHESARQPDAAKAVSSGCGQSARGRAHRLVRKFEVERPSSKILGLFDRSKPIAWPSDQNDKSSKKWQVKQR